MAAHERSVPSGSADGGPGSDSNAGASPFGRDGGQTSRQHSAAVWLMASLLATALLTMALRFWQARFQLSPET